jgi:hypothetical protein
MNYTLEETEDGGVVLARDNLIVQCPYQQESYSPMSLSTRRCKLWKLVCRILF